jgi:restriction endonuclease Mrr
MGDEHIDAWIAAFRDRAAAEVRAALQTASPAVLQRIAIDLVPSLVRVGGYTGQAYQVGADYGDAVAQPGVAGLPTILVRVHRGPFDGTHAKSLFDALKETDATQAAIAVIADRPVDVQQFLGTLARWQFDTDGLVNLMLNANVGVTVQTFEAKSVDAQYFA